ncbi:amidohydrolase family protein [Sphingobium yanoikuyae]|uniref:Amidohydrolase n=1 Tax=Sphingobium yanoikuyae TaxID=13690 RepID=A0A9X7U593_SPHYA|nr:amidohydrolase family protein [Sphingobium yanoikuyae]QNG43966.1 amidohydrolase [Sphingobium yanoikuyae]
MPILQLPIEGAPPKADRPIRKIAIEEHFIGPDSDPHDHEAAIVRHSGIGPKWAAAAVQRLADMSSIRIDEMDAAGIDVSILSLTSPGIEQIPDAATAIQTARAVNDYLADHIASSKGRFEGFASVALQDVDAAIAELRRAVDTLGLRGVLVNGYVGSGEDRAGLYLDEARFDPFWKALADLDVPLYLHPRFPDIAVKEAMYRGHPELISATWGFAPETATHALRMVYGGVFDRHPKASVILGHMGETLPFFSWRIQRAFEYNPLDKRLVKRLQDYLAENFWVTTSGHFSDQALINAILTIGGDRLLFASDYPFEMATDAARWIETAPISENDRRKICYGNAEALFGIAQ